MTPQEYINKTGVIYGLVKKDRRLGVICFTSSAMAEAWKKLAEPDEVRLLCSHTQAVYAVGFDMVAAVTPAKKICVM